jgi:uncharacterized protein (TIRG00374 family)
MMKKTLKMLIGSIGLITAVLWAVHGVPFADVLEYLKRMNGLLLVVVFILTTVNLFIRAMVWRQVVGTLKPVSIIDALMNYVFGVFSNLFLPLKLGDVAQGYVLGKNQQINTVSAVSAVLIQRVFEVSSLLLVMSFVALGFSVPYLYQQRVLALILILLVVVLLLVVAYQMRGKLVDIVQQFLSRYSQKIAETVSFILDNFIRGTSAIQNKNTVFRILLLSIISWGVQICMVKYTADAMGIDIDFLAATVVLMIINIGLTIPLAPGNIGTFQVFGIIALSFYSVTKSKALAFSIVYQMIQGIPVIIGGALSLILYLKK